MSAESSGGRRIRGGGVLPAMATLAGMTVVVATIVLFIDVTVDGWRVLDVGFLSGAHSRDAGRAGIGPALAGSFWLAVVTVAVAFPIGLGSAVFLEEYVPPGPLNRLIQSTMASLAGVPSVIYGLLGLAVFVRGMALGESVLAAGLTLAALSVPTVFLTAREAIRSVPRGLREAAYGLGATRWQVVSYHVLPAAIPGIVTGSTLAFSRAVGETAPLLVLGALSFVTFAPASLGDPFTSLPTQIYSWVARPADEFRSLAAGAIIVLLLILLGMNLVALLVRRRYARLS